MRWRLLVILTFIAPNPYEQIAGAADNVWSVQTLIENKPWDKFVDPAVRIRIEGRMGSSGSSQAGGSFRLVKCDAKFVVDSAKLRSISSKNTVEARGYFKKTGSTLEFQVDDLKVVPAYVEQFDSRASQLTSKLKRTTHEEWTGLGDWVARYGRFYDDAELMKKADVAYSKSIEVEYESLKPADAEGRFLLARKIDSYKLSSRRRMELIHQGLRIQWQTLQKAEAPDLEAWRKFATGLADHLPETDVPLGKVSQELKQSYEQDPVSTYHQASDQVRNQLHRMFFVEVVRKRLLHGMSNDGRDGDLIADQIEKQIPEESSLAEKHRLLSLGYRLAHVASANRADVEQLASAYRARHQDETAKLALLQWVKSHELRLKGDGVIGLVQLADEYLSLLNNEAVAVEYLTDAYNIDPNFEGTKSKLASLGYQWRNSRWTKSDLGKPEVTSTKSQSPTGIALGMTATDLRKLLGQPGSLARAITSRGITEVWSFGPAGSSRLVVRLEQKGADTEPRVNAVTNPR